MKKIVGIFALLMLNSVGYAIGFPNQSPLDTVTFQMVAKQWVSTKTALLKVNVNVTLGNADFVKARADIMEKLSKIAPGEWHLTQFDRSQDTSGLEKLSVSAELRVLQNLLTNVYLNAKSVSKPGASYEIGSVEFKPSIEEIQGVRTQLRERLYQQVQDELARINKVYTSQNYTLNYLSVVEGDVGAFPQPKFVTTTNAMAISAAEPTLAVSNELTMTAVAQVASNRQQGTK